MNIFKILAKEIKISKGFIIKSIITVSVILSLIFTILAFIKNYFNIFNKYLDQYNNPILYQVTNMDKSKLEKIGEKYPVLISITDDFSFFIDGKENSCLYKFFNYNLLSTNNNFDFSYINGNIDFNCSIFLSKEIMDNNGLCIGDDVTIEFNNSNKIFNFIIAGEIPVNLGYQAIFPQKIFNELNYSNYLVDFILESGYDLYNVGEVLLSDYTNNNLYASDGGIIFGIYYYMLLAYRILIAILLILIIYFVFSIINFYNLYFLTRDSFYSLAISVGLDIDRKIFLFIFSMITFCSTIIGYLFSLIIIKLIAEKLNNVIQINNIYLSFHWVILIGIIVFLCMYFYVHTKKKNKSITIRLKGAGE